MDPVTSLTRYGLQGLDMDCRDCQWSDLKWTAVTSLIRNELKCVD